MGEIKRFVKSYHEIRHNLADTSYIPNFDDFDLLQKQEVIAAMSHYSETEIGSWDVEAIESEFSKIISHEVRDLERDVGNIS
jgi:hypothetical protein